jgi:ketosteroid isomerase-like protein
VFAQPIDVVRALYAAGAQGDFATVVALLDPEVEIIEPDSLPFGGVYRGLSGFQQAMAAIAGTFADFQAIPEHYLAGDDHVAVLTRVTARLVANDAPIAVPVVDFWRVRAGKIIQLRPFYWDTAEVLQAADLASLRN